MCHLRVIDILLITDVCACVGMTVACEDKHLLIKDNDVVINAFGNISYNVRMYFL